MLYKSALYLLTLLVDIMLNFWCC